MLVEGNVSINIPDHESAFRFVTNIRVSRQDSGNEPIILNRACTNIDSAGEGFVVCIDRRHRRHSMREQSLCARISVLSIDGVEWFLRMEEHCHTRPELYRHTRWWSECQASGRT